MALLGADQVLVFGGYDASKCNREAWMAIGSYGGIWYRAYLPLVAR
jgi:hypothetical protein